MEEGAFPPLCPVPCMVLILSLQEAGSEVDPVSPSLEEATKYCQARLKKAQAFSDVAMATQSSSTGIPSTN